ncbi:DUF4238 domain-containing protein (plasmid) [Ensifer adhaerens]|uniref:DUF4238 domain-containing protein n=1 Tax=Ensifer adhaerens TaxID=106592 RepID=UPI001CBEB934|nr:DUF4238 domain-containing protein [Ensifer adhaerens]MBZ7927074.1 DUF4238 domain-containing protein [Ensifer adhaerens]UAX98121.1 DUF4238 domain-containing protein [Ensifer adhaerens]UAY05502.1 DUF4238 domain-containing protein [Ensifer adhaerens]UAY12880.1 DUF4238 domain-containing protein [Ensifer adhaerens]
MANRKQQHFVPQFMLRHFAADQGHKTKPRQINLVNISSAKIIVGASLAGQCYRDYFYGKDGVFEESLSQLEGVFSALARKMINSCSIDVRDGWDLILMISLQRARTARAGDEFNSMAEKMLRLYMHNRVSEEVLRSVRIGLKEVANHNISTAFKLAPLLMDLKQLLVINRTSTPFIIADNPVVSTNLFGRMKAPDRMAGLTRAGLQLFMPLSPQFGLLFHDPNVYSADALGNVLRLKSKEDAFLLNELQWLNAYENIYFPPSLLKSDLDALVAIKREPTELSKMTRAERRGEEDGFVVTTKDEFAAPSEGVKSELVFVSATTLSKDVRLRGIRIRDKPRYHDDGSMGSFVRDPIWEEIVRDFADEITHNNAKASQIWEFVADHPDHDRVGPWLQRAARRTSRRRAQHPT